MIYLLNLEIIHNCPFSLFAREFPDLRMNVWCNNQNDIIELKGKRDIIEKAIKTVNKLGKVEKIYSDLETTELLMKKCTCLSGPLSSVLQRFDILELPPVKYSQGIEYITILVTPDLVGTIIDTIREEDPEAIIKIKELSPLRKKDDKYPHYLPSDQFIDKLTKKQLQALILAYKGGYYEIPRKNDCVTIADSNNLNRRTFAEHLRKAEQKIMENFIPAILLKEIK